MSEQLIAAGAGSAPILEFVFEVRLRFTRVQMIPGMPSGAMRGAVYVDSGEIRGPRLNGKAVPNSGGDYALFRPDDVVSFDARYMLEADDGALILMRNRGHLWGRNPDTMQKLRDMAFKGGPVVDPSEYYLRSTPSFEVAAGRHDWLMRHVFVGLGERRTDGNFVRYFVVT